MCEYFVKADPIQYEQRSRTVRIRNVLTSIRLENMVWEILADMAEEEGCTTNALISKFHDEILAHRGEVPNFASFLRVTSMRYMRRCMQAMRSEQDKLAAPANAQSNAQPTGPIAVLGGSIALVQGQGAQPAPKMLAAVGR